MADDVTGSESAKLERLMLDVQPFVVQIAAGADTAETCRKMALDQIMLLGRMFIQAGRLAQAEQAYLVGIELANRADPNDAPPMLET